MFTVYLFGYLDYMVYFTVLSLLHTVFSHYTGSDIYYTVPLIALIFYRSRKFVTSFLSVYFVTYQFAVYSMWVFESNCNYHDCVCFFWHFFIIPLLYSLSSIISGVQRISFTPAVVKLSLLCFAILITRPMHFRSLIS